MDEVVMMWPPAITDVVSINTSLETPITPALQEFPFISMSLYFMFEAECIISHLSKCLSFAVYFPVCFVFAQKRNGFSEQIFYFPITSNVLFKLNGCSLLVKAVRRLSQLVFSGPA